MEKKVKKVIEDILKALEIDADFELTEKEEGYDVVLSTEDSGIIIGHHGDTLEALQTIISLAISKKLGEFKRVSVEVGDYKKNREEWLKSLAGETKEKVLTERKEIFLPDLKSWERRIVHLILQDDEDVVSESIGEGKDRVLVVKPRS
ncbi:MAG TPA: R3H domain-containing nucleic acid-binding protein [Patescibacteria group bacterium]|nr:R3H domain-containing nucleic acid-binding protein [Patescibacteria group bacterium]